MLLKPFKLLVGLGKTPSMIARSVGPLDLATSYQRLHAWSPPSWWRHELELALIEFGLAHVATTGWRGAVTPLLVFELRRRRLHCREGRAARKAHQRPRIRDGNVEVCCVCLRHWPQCTCKQHAGLHVSFVLVPVHVSFIRPPVFTGSIRDMRSSYRLLCTRWALVGFHLGPTWLHDLREPCKKVQSR